MTKLWVLLAAMFRQPLSRTFRSLLSHVVCHIYTEDPRLGLDHVSFNTVAVSTNKNWAVKGCVHFLSCFSSFKEPLKHIQGDSFGTRPKKMRISQRLFIRFWTCIYDYILCFMRRMSILVCRSLTSWRHRDNDWRLAPRRAQPCYCVVR